MTVIISARKQIMIKKDIYVLYEQRRYAHMSSFRLWHRLNWNVQWKII